MFVKVPPRSWRVIQLALEKATHSPAFERDLRDQIYRALGQVEVLPRNRRLRRAHPRPICK